MTGRAGIVLAAAGALAVAAAPGCKPSAFDDLSKDTWVDVEGPPDELGSSLFGAALASAGPSDSGGAVFMAVAKNPDGLGHIRYDAEGKASTLGITTADFMADGLPDHPVLAGDTANAVFGLAMVDTMQATVAVYDRETGSLIDQFSDGGIVPITALDFGATDAAGDTTVDAFLIRGDELIVLPDYTEGSIGFRRCLHGRQTGFSAHTVDLGGPAGDEIVAFIGNEAGDGTSRLIVITGDRIVQRHIDMADSNCFDDVLTDPLYTIDAPDAEGDWGFGSAVGDFDGDGNLDIAGGSPSLGSLHIIYDPLGTPEVVTVTGPAGSSQYGISMAAGDLDGDGDDELVVGDPRFATDGTQNAGIAYLYDFTERAAEEPLVFSDAEPESNQQYGHAVAFVDFDGNDILVVGARAEVFTYFRTVLSDDVRAGAPE